jgi:hypothetical protein
MSRLLLPPRARLRLEVEDDGVPALLRVRSAAAAAAGSALISRTEAPVVVARG